MTIATLIIAALYAAASITAALKSWPRLAMFAAGLAAGNAGIYLVTGHYIAAAFWAVITALALFNIRRVNANAVRKAEIAALDKVIADPDRRIGGVR
jgi:hypothetical protein